MKNLYKRCIENEEGVFFILKKFLLLVLFFFVLINKINLEIKSEFK